MFLRQIVTIQKLMRCACSNIPFAGMFNSKLDFTGKEIAQVSPQHSL
jgi:hypothetical protein